MPLGRQRFFKSAPLYSDDTRKTEEDGNAAAKTAIAPHGKHRERRQTSANIGEHRRASTSADRTAPLRMVTLLTTKNDLVVKSAAIRKSSFRSAGDRPAAVPPTRRLCRPGQSDPTNSLTRVEQLVSSNQPVPDVRAAHADVHWHSDRTRNQIHRQANEAPRSTRQALPRAPQAKSRAP